MPIVVDIGGELSADALCTKATLKRVIGGIEDPTAEHDDDTLFNLLIGGCSSLFEKECKRVFTQAAMTEYYSSKGIGFDTFRIKNPPIASSPTPQLWEDTEYAFGSDTAYTINTDFQYDPDNGIVKLLYGYFNRGFRNIKITYTGGWETIPDDVQLAVAEWAAVVYKNVKDNRWGLSTKMSGEFQISTTAYMQSLPLETQKTINWYRPRT